MKQRLPAKILLVLLTLLLPAVLTLLPSISHASAQQADTPSYDLSWRTVDNGGASGLTSGSYTLSGTIGQPDAGVLSTDLYDLAGGFWAGILIRLQSFLPLIRK